MTKKLIYCVAVIAAWLLSCNSVRAGEEQREFWVFDSSNGLADNSAQTITCTKTGRMVISTIGHINFYDGYSFDHIDPTQDDVFPLPRYNGHYHMYFDKHHHLWLKDKKSVTCVDLLMEHFIQDVGGVIKELGMSEQVDDMFGDQNNLLWFLSGDKLYNPELGSVVPVEYGAEIYDIDVYAQKMLIQFFADGMTKAYDVKSGRHLFDAPAFQGADKERYASSAVLSPREKGYYQICNGEQRGILLYFDVEARQWTVLMETPYHLNNMVEHDGKLYIASEYGYWTYDLQTGAKEHVERLLLSKGRMLETDINTLAFDRQGGMWIGTERRGLLYAKPYPSPFIAYEWKQPEASYYYQLMEQMIGPEQGRLARRLNCRYKDSRGWTWEGTYTGLEVKKGDDRQSEVFTKHDGLTNEVVHCIVEDDHHDIWIGTSYGISHIFIKDGAVNHIESYVGSDDVPNESFVNGRAVRLPSGLIVMQSLDHVVVFNPAAFRNDDFKQVKIFPKLIRVMVNGIDVKAGMEIDGQVVLDRAVTRVKYINVNYDQNSLSLHFSGLNYFRPMQTYYRVRVKGVHGFNNWRVLSYSNSGGLVDRHGIFHLPLMGIKPGQYEVELQAAMVTDEWEQEPYVWVVNVEEPWWRTTGVYLSLAVVIFALLLANFLFYNRNLRLRMQRNNEEDDILRRIKAFAERCLGMSDEVLTPYSDQGMEEEKGDASEEFLSAMTEIVPFVNSHKGSSFTMRELAEQTGVETTRLYGLLSDNLYKSPQQLVVRLRLKEAAELLKKGNLPIEDVAGQCHFVSPNYFIACFYHYYRMTPEAYRNSTAR